MVAIKTVCVQIGNSDDKLTQVDWSNFVKHVNAVLETYQAVRHFFGGSATYAAWQNACWVLTVEEHYIESLLTSLTRARQTYRQDSICIMVGDVQFI